MFKNKQLLYTIIIRYCFCCFRTFLVTLTRITQSASVRMKSTAPKDGSPRPVQTR